MVPLLYLLVGVASLVFVAVLLLKPPSKKNWPPGPPTKFWRGNLDILTDLPHRDFAVLRKKYGSLYTVWLGHSPCVVVASPELAKEVLITKGADYASRFCSPTLDHLTIDGKGIILAPWNDEWRRMRKLAIMHLLTNKRVEEFREGREVRARTMVNDIIQELHRNNGLVRMRKHLQGLTFGAILDVTFGYMRVDPAGITEVIRLVEESFPMTGQANDGDFLFGGSVVAKKHWDIVKRNRIGWDKIMLSLVAKQRRELKQKSPSGADDEKTGHMTLKNGGGKSDFVDLLLELEEKGELTDIEIIRLLEDIIIAGADTTAVTSEWALTMLVQNPHEQERAFEEIMRVVGPDRPVNEGDIPQLPYVQAIIKETLRLHMPAPLAVPHLTTKEVDLEGYKIPPKTQVLVDLLSVATDPKLFEDPEAFRPSRWLKNGESLEYSEQDVRMLPFGAGRRSCIGKNLGLRTAHLILGTLLQGFRFEATGTPPASGYVDEEAGLTCRPKHPMIARVFQRGPIQA